MKAIILASLILPIVATDLSYSQQETAIVAAGVRSVQQVQPGIYEILLIQPNGAPIRIRLGEAALRVMTKHIAQLLPQN